MKRKDKNSFTFFVPESENAIELPFISHRVKAGFPSPAEDFMESRIDLNRELTRNPLSTFYIKVCGNSMTDAGIDNNDILVVDRSLEPGNGKIAICFIDGEFTVKRLKTEKEALYLMPENKAYNPIKVTTENQFAIWGVVTYVIKSVH